MELLENHGVIVTIATFLLGLIVAFITNYIKFMNEFNFIKGQLSQILEMHEDVTGLIEKHAKLDRDFLKIVKDTDKAFIRIKFIESKILNGGTF